VPNVKETWEPKPPGSLWATPGLLRDCFTFLPLPLQLSRETEEDQENYIQRNQPFTFVTSKYEGRIVDIARFEFFSQW